MVDKVCYIVHFVYVYVCISDYLFIFGKMTDLKMLWAYRLKMANLPIYVVLIIVSLFAIIGSVGKVIWSNMYLFN